MLPLAVAALVVVACLAGAPSGIRAAVSGRRVDAARRPGHRPGPRSRVTARVGAVLRLVPAALPRRVRAAAGRPDASTRQDLADLTGRLAALTRGGLPVARAWDVLATGGGPGAPVAREVSATLAVGARAGAGLRSAARRTTAGAPVASALGWFAVAVDVIDEAGAPSAAVYDGLSAGLLAELARADEQDVALAGPRATAALLAALPLAGLGLGAVMGADVAGALLGTPVGRGCLVTGALLWAVGRWWTRRLVRRAGGAG